MEDLSIQRNRKQETSNPFVTILLRTASRGETGSKSTAKRSARQVSKLKRTGSSIKAKQELSKAEGDWVGRKRRERDSELKHTARKRVVCQKPRFEIQVFLTCGGLCLTENLILPTILKKKKY